MEIIIDKGFLQSFFTYNSSENHKPIFDDFVKFIRKLHQGYKLIINLSSNDEFDLLVLSNPLLEIIQEKASQVVLEKDLEQKLNQPDFYEQGCCFKICLVDFSPKECNALEAAYGYCFISGENMAYKWKPFFSEREDNNRYISSTAMPEMFRFDSWSKINSHKHPFNAILIIDAYLLSDKSQHQIDQNIKPMLKALLMNKKSMLPVDITIITEEAPKNSNFKEMWQKLENYLQQEFKELTINFSLICFDRNILYKMNAEDFNIHDRRIITNYFWIESGIGFNIMKNSGKVKNANSFITYRFNLSGSYYGLLKHVLKDYATYARIATEVYGSNKNRLLSQFNSN